MGNALDKFNELKDKANKVASLLEGNATDETGYPGSGPVRFPSANDPAGTKTLDIKISTGKIPEISRVILYECLDELKNDGSYRFSGMEVIWTDKVTGRRYREERMCGDKTSWRTREINALDYVKELSIGTKTHDGVEYVSYCGIEPNIAEPAGAGLLQAPLKTVTSSNSQFTEGALGFRIRIHKKLKVIVNVDVVWARVADKKVNVDRNKGMVQSFFRSLKDLADNNKKIYEYKSPENKYEDFASLITHGQIHDEYLGGLPVRFLAPEEFTRYQNLVSSLQLEPLVQVLKTKGNIHHVKLDPAVEDKVINFCVKVLSEELFKKSASLQENIRFVMKMLCIVFTDDEGIWKKITEKLKADYERIGGTLFDEAMDEVQKDPKLAELQKIENMEDPEVKGKYQKACPQNPDKGGEEDVEKLAKAYMLDAAQFMSEFHATFRSKFGKNYHGAPVKGLDRIKAKCQEYKDENKLNASDSVARIMDFLRGTVECKNGKEVVDAFNEINKIKGDFKIVRVKNGFKDVTKKGFKFILLNIMIYDSIICEVQITYESMKKGNDINHFIYEVLREHSLYAMVAKNLNLTTAFKEWLEPLAPKPIKVNFPVNASMNWKGFWIEGDSNGLWNVGKTKRCYFLMNFTIDKTGKIVGNCGDQNGDSKIEGKLDVSARTIEFKKTPLMTAQPGMYGPPSASGPAYHLEYKGKFLDKSMAEGEYVVKMNQSNPANGLNFLGNLGGGDQKGFFRIWADDTECPGLNAGLMAFRDITKNSKIIRKKYLNDKPMKWTGVLGGADKGKDLPIEIKLKIQNPLSKWNVNAGQAMTGSGKAGKDNISNIDGAHADYDTLIMEMYVRAGLGNCFSTGKNRNITINGYFMEDLKLTGTYDDNGHMGRFSLECQDAKAKKEFAPKGENEDDRWELLVIAHDGKRQYSQISFKPSSGGILVGKGNNIDGSFEVKGKDTGKTMTFEKNQNNEKIEFDGQLLTQGLYEGFYRSPTSYGRFKLIHS